MVSLTGLPASAELMRSLSISATPASAVRGVVRPGWQTENGTRIAGIELRLAPGWKTYWRSPGEAGIPPVFDWSASENLADVRIMWPRPEIFVLNGMRTLGYKDSVVLPVELTPVDPARPVLLRATVEMGVCRDVCLPADLTLDADLPAGSGQADAVIRAAIAAQPKSARQAGLSRLNCRVEPVRDGLRVTASMDLGPMGGGEETVVLEPDDRTIWVSAAAVSRNGRHLSATSDLVAPSGQPFALNRAGLTVTVIGSGGAAEQRGCPAAD